MSKTIISGYAWVQAIISGSNNLHKYKDEINRLNVFPVPDGDTGSNMYATISETLGPLNQLEENTSISEVSEVISQNMLLGARGNSGVILSQIFKGFALSLKDKESANLSDLIHAFEQAQESAYKVVLKPVEGTILSVIKEIATCLKGLTQKVTTISELFAEVVQEAARAVENTPNQLQVLKEVGVVDSGGRGLYEILRGMQAYFDGAAVAFEPSTNVSEGSFISDQEVFSGEFGYCTEFVMKLTNTTYNEERIQNRLEKIAQSLVIIRDGDLLKIHGHTLRPGRLLEIVTNLGTFQKIKIDNMTIQAQQSQNNQNFHLNLKTAKNCAVISCNEGKGLVDEMRELGAAYIIPTVDGNPSAKQFIDAIYAVKAKNVFILPNDKNAVLAAKQASQTIDNKRVFVMHTTSQITGIYLMQYFSEDNSFEDNMELMLEGLESINVGQVTLAAKTTKLHGAKIKKGEYLAIAKGKIVNTKKSSLRAAKYVIEELVKPESEVVTIFYGNNVSRSDAEDLEAYIKSAYDLITEIKSGQQKTIDYLIGVA